MNCETFVANPLDLRKKRRKTQKSLGFIKDNKLELLKTYFTSGNFDFFIQTWLVYMSVVYMVWNVFCNRV